MRFRKLRCGKKGVSPVIATLLMIAIAVAAGILVYVWSMGLVGTLQAGGGEQTKEQIMMEAYDWTNLASLEVFFRNTGTTSVQLESVYVEGQFNDAGSVVVGVPGSGSETTTITCTGGGLPATVIAGQSYNIKVVTATGAVFSFSAVAGDAG